MNMTLPTDPTQRKGIPLATGLLDYFPAALAEVARLSQIANDQHNPGEDLHWARGKSMDHADCILRHQIDRGGFDTDNVRHSAKVAWRALAQLQIELEEQEGAPMPRGARLFDVPSVTPALAWDEGWECPCGSTKVGGYEHEAGYLGDKATIAGLGPLCDNRGCTRHMTRKS